MKKVLFIIIISLGFFDIWGQSSAADKLFDKYSGKEGFTSVYISKYMFNMFMNLNDSTPQNKEMKDVVSRLNSIKILAVDDKSKIPAGVNLYQEIMKAVDKNEYKELMVIKEKDQDVKFLVKENDGKVSELLLVVGGKGDNVLISIQGDIDMKNISKLAKAMDIQGMEKLEDIDKK
jgi:hypothetical protein